MRHQFHLTSLLFFTAFTGPALTAQSPVAWSAVLHRPLDNVLVQARVVAVDGIQYLQFRNEGQEAINFSFSVNGEDPFSNPRIHVQAHKRSPYLPLPMGIAASTFKFRMLRKGQDEGLVLPE